MGDRFGHSNHVFRVGALFALGFLFFVVVRSLAMPKDFGTIGFYRAGALADIAAHPISYAGEESCAVCHTAEAEQRQASKHVQVHCEACHGPLAAHVAGDLPKPKLPDPKVLCVRCHLAIQGKPANFPVINPAEHSGDVSCTECHKPHHPKIGS